MILSRFPNEVIKEEPNLVSDMAEMQIDEKENKVFSYFVYNLNILVKKIEEPKYKSANQTISAALFGENCAYGGFEDGLICCWNIKVLVFIYIFSIFFLIVW